MTNLLTHGRTLLLTLSLGGWGWVAAQSLGTPAAEAWMGRPLEMTVPARFLSPDAECVQADVFYGEHRLRTDQVRATVVGNDQKRVRIQADALINEPIVTVSVRAGCGSSITRNYTLLPELPSEAVIAGWNRQPIASAVSAANASPLRMATSTSTPATGPRVRPSRATAAQPTTKVAAAAPRKRDARAFRQEPPAGPRLRLEPLEFEPQAVLRTTSSLAQPAGDAASRATAALLWQAINADPQELLRTSAMLKKLEGDMLQLRQSTSQTRAEMAALRQRIEEAQPWYASRGFAQLLALLVLAAATAAGVMWFRARRNAAALGQWYLPADPMPADAMLQPQPAAAAETVAAPRVQPVVLPPVIARTAMAAATPQPASRQGAAAAGDLPVPAGAQPARPRRIAGAVMRVETLAATFEEVEFLSSLGLASDAMDVLKAYLQDSSNPAPIAFFELMRLCGQAEDPAAVAMVRRRYEKAFGCAPPGLGQVTEPRGLDGMSQLSAAVTRAWGQPDVLDIIEDALFSVPPVGAALTLQAGRDLICLHGLALNLAAETAGGQAADGGTDVLAPWAHAEDTAGALAATQDAVDSQGGGPFALDIDLGAAAQALPEKDEALEEFRLAPMLAEMQATAAREAEQRNRRDEEDAFSAAMSSERVPVSRF